MQTHEEQSSEFESTLSQHRVTPQELTRALASIEARKQEAARRQKTAQEAEQTYLEQTIPIDEAIRELSLEATPEEVWAEVSVERAAAPSDEATLKESGDSFLYRSQTYIQTTLDFLARSRRRLQLWQTRRRLQLWQIGSALLAMFIMGTAVFWPRNHTFPLPTAANNSLVPASASAFNVSNFPDAIPFELTGESLNKVLHGEDTSKIGIDPGSYYDPNAYTGFWNLIKYEGHVYVRGYVPAPPTEDALPERIVNIDNIAMVPENGDRPAEITLRLDTLKFCSFYDRINVPQTPGYVSGVYGVMDQKITVTNVHLDQHAWERAGYVMSTQQPIISDRALNHTLKPSSKLVQPKNLSQNSPMGRQMALNRRLLTSEIDSNTNQFQYTESISISLYPDEKPFAIGYGNLAYLLTGTSPNALYVQSNQSNLANPASTGNWIVTKHQGHVYLRGWVAGDVTQESIAGHYLYLYNSPLPAELRGNAKQISLRLGDFQYGPRGVFYSKQWYFTSKGFEDQDALFQQQLPLTNIHLDDHAWEKW